MKTSRRLLRELMGHASNAGSLDAVYAAALQGVQVQLGVERASILLFDSAGTMRFAAWAGLSDEYRQAVDGHSPWTPDELDVTPLLIGDVRNEPSLAPFAAALEREDIRALAFVPLQFGAKLHGKFMLYYRETHVFSGEEIAAAEQIADYVVMSIEHHRLAVALKEQLASERDLRRHAEESESRLHVALAAGQMGTWEYDLLKCRSFWSEELERMHGLEPGTFDGSVEMVLKLVHPLDMERFADLLRNCSPSREADHEVEFRMVRPDGAVRWLASRGRLIVDENGTPTRIVGVCADITDLKRMAETAREADRRKDEFLATLAHELRNPLAAVRAGVAVIRKAHLDGAAVVEHCSIVERQLRQLTRMVDDLLDVADITRRGLPLEKTRVEIGAIVRMALEQVRPLIEEAGHALSARLPAEPILLDADPARLVQVLTNLLNNAVKYSPRGGRIQISVQREHDELRINVKDSGIGIPAEKLESVFEMFGQLDRSLESGYKGLGIGLALARTLVAKHGGRIKAHSEGLGRGSEFSVWLPLAMAARSVHVLGQPADDLAASTGCRVLMVDDNHDVATAMSRLMRILGHEVRVAYNGAQALELAESFRPDVVLLDIAMPQMNGYEVARALRSRSLSRNMVLVAVTGWGREHDQRRSAEAGFDRHMTKPVDPIALETFLESVSRRRAPVEDFVWQRPPETPPASAASAALPPG
jgi:PAS domain S-box-containing protein